MLYIAVVRTGWRRPIEPVVANNVSRISIKAACGFLRQHNVRVDIVDHSSEQVGYRVDGYITIASYTRLYLDEYFDEQWDRLLYLDADTRVLAPLQPLLHADLSRRALGAVDNNNVMDITQAPYLNAGVMLFDWPATLENAFWAALADSREKSPICVNGMIRMR